MARRGRKRRLELEAEYWRLLAAGVGSVEACKRLGIGRKAGYRWRAENGGLQPDYLPERHPGRAGTCRARERPVPGWAAVRSVAGGGVAREGPAVVVAPPERVPRHHPVPGRSPGRRACAPPVRRCLAHRARSRRGGPLAGGADLPRHGPVVHRLSRRRRDRRRRRHCHRPWSARPCCTTSTQHPALPCGPCGRVLRPGRRSTGVGRPRRRTRRDPVERSHL